MDSTGLIAAATIELNDLLKQVMAIDRENENYVLSITIVLALVLYLGFMMRIKKKPENKQADPLLYLNGAFIVAFIVLYIFGKEIASLYFLVRPDSKPKPKTEETASETAPETAPEAAAEAAAEIV
ncbi:hypothetical protein MOSE0_F00298 [Monosporozyma servazzii]